MLVIANQWVPLIVNKVIALQHNFGKFGNCLWNCDEVCCRRS
ncbi:hypothetical protein FDUTEX481_10088 [Tolypothrix sp. PCC 7601]|nr:hypothetical protein FDUTEX481_10088 [Tolypothrix sp. PCC 7601]